jgi:hypothetical protein
MVMKEEEESDGGWAPKSIPTSRMQGIASEHVKGAAVPSLELGFSTSPPFNISCRDLFSRLFKRCDWSARVFKLIWVTPHGPH